MKLIELHILQSFPVSCLNRDDVGAPKTAVFGGATRARISSQCLKRAIREQAKLGDAGPMFGGSRSRLIIAPLQQRLAFHGLDGVTAMKTACEIGDLLATLDEKTVKKSGEVVEGKLPRVKTLMFLAESEIDAIARAIAALRIETPKAKITEKLLEKACAGASLKDAVDIALFGRMVASASDLTLEGAAMFAHALSVHKADTDIDFFAAVDDRKELSEDAGAGHTGVIEFNSACYYRYAALNLDLLFDERHLAVLSTDERRQVVDAFIRATLLAMPSARQNSMNAHVTPSYVLGLYKDRGQPMQLVNAFEKSIWSKDGLVEKSVEALKQHHAATKATWSLPVVKEAAIPEVTLDAFCKELVSHV